MSTIKDVARLAGVSTATVSNYLNSTKQVRKETSLKIQKAVDELHYTLNQTARNLKARQNADIGVILPSLNDPYYVQLFQGIKSYFQPAEYYINLAFSENIPESEDSIARNFLRKQICGLILVSCQPENWKFYHDNYTSQNIPLVLIDRNIHSLDANYISFNNRVLMRDMIDCLFDENYRNIYLMSGPHNFECESECIRGFCDSYRNHGTEPPEIRFLKTDMSKEDAFRKTIKLLKTQNPDAIVATSQSLAAGIIEGITILGYTIQDIPVFTLGEEHWNLHTHSFASGSTVRPAMKLGQFAAKLLTEQLRSPLTKETERIILSGGHFNRQQHLFSPVTANRERSAAKIPKPAKTIRALLLDTPQVHSLLGLIRNFEIKTGISVEPTLLPHHLLYKSILQMHNSESETPYDVVMYDIPWLPSFASEGILANITPEMQSFNTDIFLTDCLKYYSNFNRNYYGVPFMYAPQIFYYRKDLFEDPALKITYERENNISLRPPVTLKEFNTIADFFTNKTNVIRYGTSIPTAYSECLTPEIYMRLRAYGGNLFDSSGHVCLDSNHALKAYINFMKSLKYAKPDYRTATDTSVVEDFLSGETAMLISYPSFLTDVTDLRKNSIIGSIGYSLIPGRAPLLGGWSLGISSRSQYREPAFEFLKWTCDEQISSYSTLLGGQSAISSTYTNDELAELYPWLPLYHSIYQYTKPTIPPKLSNHTVIPQHEIDEVVCRWIYKLLDYELEVQGAITNTHKELEFLVHTYMEQS